MFGPTRYIQWAMSIYGSTTHDLATSGIPLAKWSDLGVPPPDIDDRAAYEDLRRAIARYNDVPQAEVIPALGTAHAIFLAYSAMLSPGDELLVESPGYEPLTRVAEGLGATVRTFRREAEEGFRLVPERVAAAMTPRTRAVVVTNLQNPTGVRAELAELRELAEIAAARGGHLVVDEVYAPFDDLPEDGVFRASARKLAPNVIAVGSLTKCYGLGMYRVGWVLGPEEIIAGAAAATIATVVHLPLAHASYGAVALGAIGALARRAKSMIIGRRAIVEQWARSLRDAHWSAPQEGLFGMVTLHGRGDLLARIESCARETGALVGAGTFFGAPESFRVSWASCGEKKLEEGLDRLARITR